MTASPFLEVPSDEWLASNRSAFAIRDRFPVTEGHALVIPRRLIPGWWDASRAERLDILELVDEVRAILDERYRPDGYNLGINVGAAAGQTVDHLHVHVIPRHAGDVPDPRGGVRHVIPARGNYLAAAADSALPAASPREPQTGMLLDGVQRTLELELVRAIINEIGTTGSTSSSASSCDPASRSSTLASMRRSRPELTSGS